MNKTKECKDCKAELLIEEFPPLGGKGRKSARCRPCKQAYDREYWKNNSDRLKPLKREATNRKRDKVIDFLLKFYMEHPCEICGEKDPLVLEFDHIDPSAKEYNIGDMARLGYSINNLRKEMAKCRVLCANCHRRHTAKQFNFKIYEKLQGMG